MRLQAPSSSLRLVGGCSLLVWLGCFEASGPILASEVSGWWIFMSSRRGERGAVSFVVERLVGSRICCLDGWGWSFASRRLMVRIFIS